VLELLRPFLETGVVVERDGRLVLVDRAILAAFGGYEP
jgi:hypothetical protein